jgi:hypothetical protein
VPPPPPSAPKETAIAIATIESVRGQVFALVAGARKPVPAGQAIAAGQGLEAGDASAAVIAFPDGTSVELRPGTLLSEISAAAGKKLVLEHGGVYADVARQPAGQPLVLSTRHAEAVVLGTKLALHCGEAATRLELKEGKVRFTRSEDKRGVDVAAGQCSVAGKGVDLAPRKITRGPMMLGAIWGEDFQEPEEIDKDWTLTRNGILVSTRGQLDFDLSPGGMASLNTRASYAPPFRVSVDVEFTQRLKGTLIGFRFQSWKQGKDLIHLDLDEDRYYLTLADQTVTADVPRRTPRRERWTLDVAADGNVSFLVDWKPVLRARRGSAGEEFHIILMTKATAKDVPPGAHVRFDNLVVEKLK